MNHPDKTNLDTPDIENVNVLDFEAMPSPEDIHARVPLSPQAKHTVMAGREALRNILDRKDPRFFVVVGPCSIHDPVAGLDYARRLKALADDLLAEDLPEGLFDTAEDSQALSLVQALHAAVTKARQEVESAATALQERGQALKGELEASPWFARIGAAKMAYEQLKADLQQQGVSDPSEYGRLVQEKQRLEIELKKLEALQKQHTELREKAKSLLEQVQSARRAISAQRSAFLQATLQGNPFVRIELIPYSRDAQGIERSLREVLGAAEGKYVDDL